MRYIIYGAGGIGGTIGGRLAQAGREVTLICRGAHLTAIQRDGLRLRTPEGDLVQPLSAVAHPREIEFRPDDVVILTMKTQDTERALLDLELAAGTDIAVICCQNGVENERLAARRFRTVYAMLPAMPATFLDPGVVINSASPLAGTLDLGRYPAGSDALAEQVASDLRAARFACEATVTAMELKYAKLLSNTGNALEVIAGQQRDASHNRVHAAMQAEAKDCYRAAGIAWSDDAVYQARAFAGWGVAEVPGAARGGGSTLQGVQRGNTTIEADYLNGELVLLGALHGVPTPVNALVRRLAVSIAASAQPHYLTMAELEQLAGLTQPV